MSTFKTTPKIVLKQQAYLPGIIGGMGSLAGVQFQLRLIDYRKSLGVLSDQCFPRWIYVNAADIPSRLCNSASAEARIASELVRAGRFLQSGGVDFLVVPCNAAHGLRERVSGQLQIPWIGLPQLVAESIVESHPSIRKVALLATSRTVESRIYDEVLGEKNIEIVFPKENSGVQSKLMEAIYHPTFGVKASGTALCAEAKIRLSEVVEHCEDVGAQLAIIACTEISVMMNQVPAPKIPIVDSLTVLAHTTIEAAYGMVAFDSLGNILAK